MIKWKMEILQDVRVKRVGANIGSDHYLLIGKLYLKLRKVKVGEQRHPYFNVDELKDSATQQKFIIALKNKFSVLTDDIPILITNFNQAMKDTVKENISFRKTVKESWISLETIRTI